MGPMGLDQFRFDSIELQPTHLRLVSHLARRIVASWRTARPIGAIYLVGHTDVRGTNAYNQALGRKVAEQVYFSDFVIQ